MMILEVKYIGGFKYAEVSADETNSGVLDAKEAKDFAINLIRVANDLLALVEK
jgi:hypothetical protein